MDILVTPDFWQSVLQRLRYFGWPLIASLIMTLLTAVITLLLLLPGWQQLQSTEHALAELKLDMPKHQGKFIESSPQASLNAFYDFLPSESQAINSLSLIILAADEYGVSPQKAEYALLHNPDAGFSRYQVSLPVRGSYVDIRRFVITVLNELPSAALNDISFRRNSIDSEQTEAMVRFSLLFRKS